MGCGCRRLRDRPRFAHVMCWGNEKGGTGKSTSAMHMSVAVLKTGARLATIDLDNRQKSLGRIEDRRAWAERAGLKLELPTYQIARAEGQGSTTTRQLNSLNLPRPLRSSTRGSIVSKPSRPYHGGHAGHAAQRSLCRFRCAGVGRCGDLPGHSYKISHYVK